MAACTVDSKTKHVLGDVVLVAAVCSAGTTITPALVGMSRFVNAWISDSGDNATVYLTFTSSLITLSAAPSGGTQTVFMIGY
jgi:hypothetical protein